VPSSIFIDSRFKIYYHLMLIETSDINFFGGCTLNINDAIRFVIEEVEEPALEHPD